jgi:hypothetical protein
VENARGTAVRAGQAGALRPSPPHGDGAVDPLARPPARQCSLPSQCLLLRAAGLGGSDRDGDDPIAQQGQGYAWTPGIHSREQVEGWRLVTDAVHMAGGLIFLQLWHVGRISHPSLQPDGMLPVAPSANKASRGGIHRE